MQGLVSQGTGQGRGFKPVRSGKARGSVPALCWLNDMHNILRILIERGL